MAVRAQISQIVHNNLRFLITDRPSDAIVDEYVASLKKNNVSALVRVCEPSYDTSKIIQASIKVFDWGFQDGAPPPDEVVTKWLDLCEETFSPTNETFIAVHCVAGLGRYVRLDCTRLICPLIYVSGLLSLSP